MTTAQPQVHALSVDISAIPDQFRQLVVADAPPRSRKAVASGLVPMASESLVTALCYLMSDAIKEIIDTARATLVGLEETMLIGVARSSPDAGTLHELSRVCKDKDPIVEAVLLNRFAHDETFHSVAKEGTGRKLEIIANNQVRLARYPAIVEALYLNPETSMPVVARVLETCVRQGIDISALPGHEEIVKSILGIGLDEAEKIDEAAGPEDDTDGIAEDEYRDLLKAAQDEARTGTGWVSWRQIQEMNIGQKVRLAIVGNASARSILIRDRKTMVAMSVLRSPRLSEKEIAAYAANKTLPDQVIREIAKKRDWVKLYSVKKSLVQNPKTPPDLALRFMKMLTEKDLRDIGRNKEIPTFISHAAKRIMQQRQEAREKARGRATKKK